MHQAGFYKKVNNSRVRCLLCRHYCLIASGQFGFCGVRKNIDGVLYSLNYGKVVAINIDPIEKKPLHFFLPGSLTYSVACFGCNFKCQHCQNADISQADLNLGLFDAIEDITPQAILEAAIRNNCPSIAYTYTEPTVFAEFALAVMTLARKAELKNIWVSNGYMSTELLAKVLPLLDAANIDLKFFNDNNYRKICGARLQPVLDNIISLKKSGIHLELTTLIIPGLNDYPAELKKIACFIADQLSPDTPWHVSAFHPAHLMSDLEPTPPKIVLLAAEIGRSCGLINVRTGNI